MLHSIAGKGKESHTNIIIIIISENADQTSKRFGSQVKIRATASGRDRWMRLSDSQCHSVSDSESGRSVSETESVQVSLNIQTQRGGDFLFQKKTCIESRLDTTHWRLVRTMVKNIPATSLPLHLYWHSITKPTRLLSPQRHQTSMASDEPSKFRQREPSS